MGLDPCGGLSLDLTTGHSLKFDDLFPTDSDKEMSSCCD